ncbi:phosphatase PAP2 family protein [Mameliella alba]|nr:phosphatase PAP2 family protein [Mameliella sediminis]MBY6113474.1 phosphatase PAP2 family protein [Antarctobacter heliothermus]MBY6143178.1 phosphatase PAP2 family protein [Mameliella alba]
MARDGTVGHWDGSADRVPKQEGRSGWDALTAMATGPRRAVMDACLQGMFNVTLEAQTSSRPATGTVAIGGAPLVTLEAPGNGHLADKQLPYLRTYADLRADRLNEIIMQTGDIQSFFGLVGYMAPDATKWTLALNQAMLRLCTAIEMPLKHGFDVARPIAMSRKVQPLIQTPGHGAWPSGHATEAFACATLLSRLFMNAAVDPVQQITAGSELYRHAERIAMNRTVAGVHFPTDSMAGAVLGVSVAEALINLLDGVAQTPVRIFHGATYDGDFTLSRMVEALNNPLEIETTTLSLPAGMVPGWLAKMWDEAKDEW